MQFNSFSFLFLFLPAVSILYYVSARRLGTRAAQGTLVLSSLVFYSLGNPVYIPVLLGSILFNYWLGQTIVASEGTVRKRRLVLGLAVNIALLAAFKYVRFIVGSLVFLWKPAFSLPEWVFPLGISFFTLQQVMYLVDCYEKLIEPNDLLTHAALVSFLDRKSVV